MADQPRAFGDLEPEYTAYENAAISMVPIPFDKTSSWGKGADKGPDALLDASAYLEFYDMETGSEVYKKGIHVGGAVVAETSEAMIEQGEAAVKALLAGGKFPVILGGEHSITEGPVRACAAAYDGLSVLHLDAHSDRRESYEGNPYSHACIVHRLKQAVDGVVSVGVRSMDASELPSIREDTVIYASEVRRLTTWIDEVVDELTDSVYVTIDLDVFDPSELPATGTPEPGGLGWYDVMGLLKAVARKRNVVAFDVVELCPDGTRPSPYLAAKLTYTFLSYIFAPPIQ